MPGTPTSSLSDRLTLGFTDVLSDDGTRIRAWTNDPGRVRGLFAVCGVPGDTFSTMLAPRLLERVA